MYSIMSPYLVASSLRELIIIICILFCSFYVVSCYLYVIYKFVYGIPKAFFEYLVYHRYTNTWYANRYTGGTPLYTVHIYNYKISHINILHHHYL